MAWQGSLGPGSWDELFDFIDPSRRDATGPDRDREAESRCAEIIRKLVCFFASRRCPNPEDLAVETVLRVAAKCRDVDASSYSDRVGYFYGVARNVVHEVQRSGLRETRVYASLSQEFPGITPADADAWNHVEAAQSCLERCLATLPARVRQLVLRYYANEGAAKVTAHQALADELGKSVNALRIEVHRIRKTLQQCVSACLRAAVTGPKTGPALTPKAG